MKQVLCYCKNEFHDFQLFFSTAPGIVKVVAVVGTSDTTAFVLWTPPSQPNGVITGYQIIYSVYGDASNSMNQAVARDVNSFVITNLSELILPLILLYRFLVHKTFEFKKK